ncbi:MAG: type IV pilus assembly protein PilM [Patescibacteria group bacterium]
MAFSLNSLSKTVESFVDSFQKKDGESVVGIDIGTSSIKIVQLAEKKGTAVLETYGEIALGPYGDAEVGQAVNPPPEKVAEALTDVMREANVTSRVGGIAVPLSASLISLITLPTKDEQDLAAMIPIEARKYIPVPVGEVTLDWFVIPEAESEFLSAAGRTKTPNSTDVLLVAIHNATLTRLDTITKATAITPRFYEIEAFSMGRAAYEHDTAPTMVIDLGASSTRVYVIEFGIIDISHTITKGGQDLTHALARSQSLTFSEAETIKRTKGISNQELGQTSLEFIFSEARRIFLNYQRKEGKAIAKVVFVGGGAQLSGIDTIAKNYFDAPIVFSSAFDRVLAPAFIADVLRSAGPSFATAVGLALRALKK